MNSFALQNQLPMQSASTSVTEPVGNDDTVVGEMMSATDTAHGGSIPANGGGAAAINTTVGPYLHGASTVVSRLDEVIAERSARLDAAPAGTSATADPQSEQLDLLTKLRNRIQESVNDVSNIHAGPSSGPVRRVAVGEPYDAGGSQAIRQQPLEWAGDHPLAPRHDLAERRSVLTPMTAALASAAAPIELSRVANAYATATMPVHFEDEQLGA